MPSKLWTMISALILGFGILFMIFAIDTRDTFSLGMAIFIMAPGIFGLLFNYGWLKLPTFTKPSGQENVEIAPAPKYVLILSVVLGIIAAQLRVKIGTFDDNHLLAVSIATIIIYLFFYRKYKDKKIVTYFVVGGIVSYVTTLLLAAYLITTLI